MQVPDDRQIATWRLRWGSTQDQTNRQRLRTIVDFILDTRNDPHGAKANLILYLVNDFNIEPIWESIAGNREIEVPDLRGFPLDDLGSFDDLPFEFRNIIVGYWHFEGASLSCLDFSKSNFSYAHLESANLEGCTFDNAKFSNSLLQNANLSGSIISNAYLGRCNLQGAKLRNSFLDGTNFYRSHLEGCDFYQANLNDDKFLNPAKLIGVSFKPKISHQYYRFRINKYHYYFNVRSCKIINCCSKFPFLTKKPFNFVIRNITTFCGKLKIANFVGVSTKGIDWSSNRLLERYIKDQQYLEEFSQTHPILFWWWQRLSKCGQSIFRVALWASIVVLIFAFIYSKFDLINVKDLQNKDFPLFWAALYKSTNIFTNLGMGIKNPVNILGSLFIMIETILGYITLGLLLTVAGNRFARRS